MQIPNIDDLKVCKFCNTRFRVREYNMRRCTCSAYSFSSNVGEQSEVKIISRAVESNQRAAFLKQGVISRVGNEIYVMKCEFDKRTKTGQKIISCVLTIFKEDGKNVRLTIPDSMLEKVPLFEPAEKVAKFCNVIRLLK